MPTPKAPERRPDAPEAGGEKSGFSRLIELARRHIVLTIGVGAAVLGVGAGATYTALKDDKPAAVASGDASKQPKAADAEKEGGVSGWKIAEVLAILGALGTAIAAMRKSGKKDEVIDNLEKQIASLQTETTELQQSLDRTNAAKIGFDALTGVRTEVKEDINGLENTLNDLRLRFALVEGNVDPNDPALLTLAEYVGLDVDSTTPKEDVADALSRFGYVNAGDMQGALDKRVKKEELNAIKGALENDFSLAKKGMEDMTKTTKAEAAKAIAMVQCVVEHMRSEARQLESEILRKESSMNNHPEIKASIEARDEAIKMRDEIVKRGPNPNATREEIDVEAEEWLATQPHIQDEDDKIIKRVEYRRGRAQLIADHTSRIEIANSKVTEAEKDILQVKKTLEEKDVRFKKYYERLKTTQERLKAISPGLTALELALKEIEEKFSKQAVVVPPAPAKKSPPPLPKPKGVSQDPDLGNRPTSVPDGSGN